MHVAANRSHLLLLNAVRVAVARANIAQILTHVDDLDEELHVAHLLLAPHDVVLEVKVKQHLWARACGSDHGPGIETRMRKEKRIDEIQFNSGFIQ